MIDVVVTQRIKAGFEAGRQRYCFERFDLATLANDKGCLRYEWYRAAGTGEHTFWSSAGQIATPFRPISSLRIWRRYCKLAPYAVEKLRRRQLTRLDAPIACRRSRPSAGVEFLAAPLLSGESRCAWSCQGDGP